MGGRQPVPNPRIRTYDVDLAHFLRILRKWWRLVVTLTLTIALTTALINYYLLTPVYRASTLLMVTVASEKLQVNTPQLDRNNQAIQDNPTTMPVLTMNTYLGQLESEIVMKRVVESTSMPGLSINGLMSMADARIVEDSNLIILEVTHENPKYAAQIANAISEQYLNLMDELMFSSVVVISPANEPSQPIKPHKTFNVMIAILVGLILATLVAFLLEFLDNTLKTVDDINQTLELPVLAIIPSRTEQNSRTNKRE